MAKKRQFNVGDLEFIDASQNLKENLLSKPIVVIPRFLMLIIGCVFIIWMATMLRPVAMILISFGIVIEFLGIFISKIGLAMQSLHQWAISFIQNIHDWGIPYWLIVVSLFIIYSAGVYLYQITSDDAESDSQ